MNYFLKRLVPGLLIFACLGGLASAQNRLATVSVQKVFEGYWKTKQGTTMIKQGMTDIEKTTKEMVDDYKKARDEYQKLLESANDQAVAATERDKRKKSAEDKLTDLKRMEEGIGDFRRRSIATLSEQAAQMRKKILDEIKQVVTSKAKTGNYSLVLDSDAATFVQDPAGNYLTPNVLYSNGENDLTEPVLIQLNSTAPPELASPVESKPAARDEAKPGVKPDSKNEKK